MNEAYKKVPEYEYELGVKVNYILKLSVARNAKSSFIVCLRV